MQEISSHPTVADANLPDYDSIIKSFTWEDARHQLTGLPVNAGLNIAYEAVDRHANSAFQHHVAIRWIKRDRSAKDFSYLDLYELTNKFANVLAALGVNKGDTVCTFMGRTPELYIAAIAPETEPDSLKPDDNIRQILRIDSFDYLQFLIGLDEALAIQTPKEDYGRIETLQTLIDYLAKKLK